MVPTELRGPRAPQVLPVRMVPTELRGPRVLKVPQVPQVRMVLTELRGLKVLHFGHVSIDHTRYYNVGDVIDIFMGNLGTNVWYGTGSSSLEVSFLSN